MLESARATLHPEWYHGRHQKRPFFEGWYYKLVDRSEKHRYAIIPGISRGEDASKDHAFIQLLDGVTGRMVYNRYPVEEFLSSTSRFDIHIGPNRFTPRQVSLSIDLPESRVRGELSFAGLVPWPVTLASPGIMGWYAWVPFMECYHGIVSVDHEIAGSLDLDGERVDFTGGRGYSEKDWGRSFPAAWVWCQSNHFDLPGTSLTASVAVIPWLRGAFPGFIVGLWHENVLHRFATYTGARVEHLSIGEREITWVLRDRSKRLEMQLVRAEGAELRAPSKMSMDRRTAETLNATVEVRLTEVAPFGPRTVFSGRGRNAGLEAAGDLELLAGMLGGRVA